MNRTLVASFAVALLGASSSFGQAPAAAPAPAAPAAAAATPAYPATSFLATLRTQWEQTRTGVLDIASNVPEAKLDWRPGTDMTVRTFRQQLTHLAGENYLFFGMVSGDTTRPAQTALDALTTKAEIVKALTDSYAWAAAKFDALTEAQAMEPTGRGNTQRWGGILSAIRDNQDHYGNLVTMLRANDIVPRTPRAGGRGGAGGGGGAGGRGAGAGGAPAAGAPAAPAAGAPRGM